MNMDMRAFEKNLMATRGSLRAFAMNLSREPDKADDLVQETLKKAWASRESFTEGTNLNAWLFTILRNVYISKRRKSRSEVADSDGVITAQIFTPPAQEEYMHFLDLCAALEQLPSHEREAIMLVGVHDATYGEAARITGCPLRTMQSRVRRARMLLEKMLNPEVPDG
jgi:RNA polymerase sigma-70 factor, ECF subfamily